MKTRNRSALMICLLLLFSLSMPALAQAETDLSGVSSTYQNEADGVYQDCAASTAMRTKFDCKCYAAAYLEERIKLGPEANPDEVMIPIRGKCKNIAANTDYEYESCLRGPIVNPILQNVDKQKYCECYAEKWSGLYSAYTGEHSARALSGLKSQAMTECTAKILSWK